MFEQAVHEDEKRSDVAGDACEFRQDTDLKLFLEQGLDGIRQFVEAYEATLSDLVLDIVPYLSKFHSEYDTERHSIITDKLLAKCSNKELVLVGCEQLSMTRCPYSYPLILPLFDLSKPFNSDWLAQPLLSGLTEGSVCETCAENCTSYKYIEAIIKCLSQLQPEHCSQATLSNFTQIMLYIVDMDRNEVLSHPSVHSILSILELSLTVVLSKQCSGEKWDPRCLIVCSSIPSRIPLVYNMTWLFARVIPWLILLIEDVGVFVESSDVRYIVDTLVYFSNQNIKVISKHFDEFSRILDFSILVAVNNQNSRNRQDASKCIRFLTMKLTIDERMKLINNYIKHENSSVAGLFIDLLRPILSQPNLRESRIQKLSNLVKSLLNFDNFDVLEISDKILATLSMIQLCCRLPGFKVHISCIMPQFEKFLNHIDRQTHKRVKDIVVEQGKLTVDSETKKDFVPATISVQGEIVSEPTIEEQRVSFCMAQTRLDLIMFNSMSTRQVLEECSF